MLYAFGECTVDDGLYEIRRAGEACHVEPQVFGVLLYLLQNRSRVVPKEELLEAVWGDGFVTEATVNSRIMAARKAIGDDGREQRFIKTLRGRGFRFVGEVQESNSAEPAIAIPALIAAPAAVRPPADVPFGRHEEMRHLLGQLAVALSGRRQTVFIAGEAGIGKTTLLQAFLAEAGRHHELTLLQGQCLDQHGAGEAYMPLLTALGRLCRQCEDDSVRQTLMRCAPTWLVQMPWLLAAAELELLQVRSVGATRERMLREMVETIDLLSARRPLLLVLEDLHWSDHSTLDLLSWLARRTETARLMIVGTYRSADAQAAGHPVHALACELRLRGHCDELAPGLLEPAVIAEYLQVRYPGVGRDEEAASLIHRRTGGNPLFMHHFVEAWRHRNWLARDGDRWKLQNITDELTSELPADLRRLIEQQIESLAPQDQKLLEAASVAGAEFSAAAITLHKGIDTHQAERRCAEMARQRLFLAPNGSAAWPDGTLADQFRFTHHLYAEVLYDRIPAGQRAWLHCQIGDCLEAAHGSQAPEIAAELALHFVRGRDAGRAVHYLQLAAGQAIARKAYREGVDHLRNALDALAGIPDEQERMREELAIQGVLAPALVATSGWTTPEAEGANLRAAELSEQLGDPVTLASTLYGLAFVYEARGEYEKAGAILERHLRIVKDARQLVPEVEKPLLESHVLLSCSLYHQGSFEKAIEHADEGLKYYEPSWYSRTLAGYGENAGVGCHLWAAVSLWYAGFPDRALARITLAEEMARLPNHDYSLSSVATQRAIVHQLRGEMAQVEEQAAITLQLAHENGFPYRIATGSILRGWALSIQGRHQEGVALMREGLNECRTRGALYDFPYYLGLLAQACVAEGDADEGLGAVAEATALLKRGRRSFYGAELQRLQGQLLLLRGDDKREEARSLFRQAFDAAQEMGAKSLELRAAASLCGLSGDAGRAGQEPASGRHIRLVQRRLRLRRFAPCPGAAWIDQFGCETGCWLA